MRKIDLDNYKYQSIDNSLLTPYLKRFVVRPAFVLVPRWLPANMITLISSICMMLAIWTTLQYGTSWKLNYLFVPTMFFLYLVLDHLDGMQARETQTSSPLGEFCDHFLDILNDGITLLVLLKLFQAEQHPWIAICLTFGVFLGHAVTFYEQYHTGWLHFEPVSTTEAIVLGVLLMFASYPTVAHQWLYAPLWLGFSPIQWVVILCLAGGPITTFQCLKRTGKLTWRWMLYLICMSWMVAASFLVLPAVLVGPIALLYHTHFICGFMKGSLLTGDEMTPDVVAPAVCLLLIFMPGLAQGWLMWALIGYLAIRALWMAISVFWVLKRFWIWRNPELPASS